MRMKMGEKLYGRDRGKRISHTELNEYLNREKLKINGQNKFGI